MQNRNFKDIYGSHSCWALRFEDRPPSELIVLMLSVGNSG